LTFRHCERVGWSKLIMPGYGDQSKVFALTFRLNSFWQTSHR
jgi:hypothetical protein